MKKTRIEKDVHSSHTGEPRDLGQKLKSAQEELAQASTLL